MPPKTPAEPPPPRPTDAELAILRVLWEHSPASVREVLARLNARRAEPLAYTTVLRFLQIMTGKGLVHRTEAERKHVYQPAVPAQRTRRQLVGDLVDRLFGGSVQELVLEALGGRRISAQERQAIRDLLAEAEKPQKP